jgi:hypothetical protein
MYLRKKHLSRRTLLRGAGAAVALPLLDAMIPAGTALAQTAAAPTPRFGFVYFPHGAVQDRWQPAATGTGFEFSEILKPLEPYRDSLTVVSGLRNRAGESTSPHAIIAGTWLGCVAPAVSHDPMGGTSADQIAARHVGQNTPFPSIELSTEGGGVCDPGYGCSYGNTISFRTPSQPLPMEFNPRKIYYRLFGQGDSPVERRLIVAETESILDSVTEEAAALRRQLGGADRAMVGEYLESVREIERRIQQMADEDFSAFDLPEPPVGVPNVFDEHLTLMFDLMALAYQADLTRVASFMMAKEVSMRSYNNLGIPDAFHPLSHHQSDPAKMARLARVQTYHTEVFARFIDKLANMPDGDGSMLDHSIILFGSNMSNSDLHNNDKLPSAVLGRGYGRIRGDQHLNYPQDTPHANLILTLLERGGIPVESHGDSTGLISEV